MAACFLDSAGLPVGVGGAWKRYWKPSNSVATQCSKVFAVRIWRAIGLSRKRNAKKHKITRTSATTRQPQTGHNARCQQSANNGGTYSLDDVIPNVRFLELSDAVCDVALCKQQLRVVPAKPLVVLLEKALQQPDGREEEKRRK